MFYNSYCVSYCVSSADFLQQNECETDSLNEGTIKVPVMLLVLLSSGHYKDAPSKKHRFI